MTTITIHINRLQWAIIAELLRYCAEKAPMETVEVETCLMAELYRRKISSFTFFKPGKNNKMAFTLNASEIFAFHGLFAGRSPQYDQHVRIDIEPKIPALRT